jgi:predicted secreted protein
MRERDDATAALATLRRSDAAPAPERSRADTLVAELRADPEPRADLARAGTTGYRSSDATSPVQRQGAAHRITAVRANSTVSLLGRAVAVIGVLVIALIVVLIVLSR